jgi:hypothetical protein
VFRFLDSAFHLRRAEARLSGRSMLCSDDPGPDGAVLGFLTKEHKMRGFVCLGLGVLLFLAWAISYFVFHVPGVRIHLLLICALVSFMFYAFIGKRGAE